MQALPQDLRYGLRMLLRRPLLTIGISLSLALGIGANSAVFSLVDAVLFRPLNAADTSRLVSLYTSDYSGPQYGASSYADYIDFRDRTNVFESLATFTQISPTLKSDNQSDVTYGLLVSENYFDLLGVKAARGRTFQPDDRGRSQPVVVVSHSLWQKRFGGDAALVGKTVLLNNNSFTVIGIMPESFTGTDLGRSPSLFAPMQSYAQLGFEPGFANSRATRQFSIIGRLKPETSETQAQTSLNILANQFAEAYPETWQERNQQPRNVSVVAERYARVPPEVRSVLMGFAGLFTTLVGLVLLIACSNISNMLLARATARQKEMAVRAAVGASRSRLIRQLLTESLQLSLIGSILGVLLAPICIKLLIAAFLPSSATSLPIDISVNPRVILITLAIGLITGLIFGLVPALHASRSDLLLAMKDDSPVLHTGSRRFGIRNLLVMTQISASLLLLVVAGLFVRSLQKAQRLELGYNPNVLKVKPEAGALDSRDTAARLVFYNQMIERVRSLPGVEAASYADFVPSGGGRRFTTVGVENYTPRAGESMDLLNGVIAPDYFKTMGMTLTAGREFTDQDKEGAPRTVIVNEALARRYWPGQDALGKHITIGDGETRTQFEIVGVVKDANAYIFQKDAAPFFYRSMNQDRNPAMTIHVRSKGDPLALLPSLRNAVDEMRQNVVLSDAQPLSEVLNESLLMLRIVSTLTAVFGLLALTLALVGVFSVVNYSTSRRTREIGIRLALGARRADILSMILKDGLFIVGAGVVVGLLLAFACGRLISSLMFAGAGNDVFVYAAVALLQVGIAMLACFIPAYKATKVDPTEALRHE